jgi:hypothetical protein
MLYYSIRLATTILALLIAVGSVSANERMWEHPLVVQKSFVSIVLFPFEKADGGHGGMDIRRKIISGLEMNPMFDYAYYCPEGEQLETLSVKGFFRMKNGLPRPANGYWGPKGMDYLVYGRYSVIKDETRIEVFLYVVKSELVLPGRSYRASGDATQGLGAAIAKAIEKALLELEPKFKQKRGPSWQQQSSGNGKERE